MSLVYDALPTPSEVVHRAADFLATSVGYTVGFFAGGYLGAHYGHTPASAAAGASWGGRIGAKITPDIIETVALAIGGSSGPYLSPVVIVTQTKGSVRYGPAKGIPTAQAYAAAVGVDRLLSSSLPYF